MTIPTFKLSLPESPAPLSERLADAILAHAHDLGLNEGDQLPPHRELARRAGVGLGTVTKAVDLLTRRGLVRGEVGRGTFLAGAAAPGQRGVIDLTLNVPPQIISRELFLAASARAAARALEIPAGGLHDLKGGALQRGTFADWVSRTRVEISADDVLLCVGAQQAIHLAFGDLSERSEVIACEAATFPGAIAAAANLGLRLRAVEHDDEGMLPDALEAALADGSCAGVYTTPVSQNPLGFETGEARRREILEVCRRRDVAIVEDDIYGLYASKGSLTYKALAPDRVYYLTSLSKCLTPLVRAGLLAPPAERLAAITRALRAQVYGAAPTAIELACALLEMGLDTMAAKTLRSEAKARTDLAVHRLGLSAAPMPQGAPHIWLPMPMAEAERLVRRCAEQGVRLTPPTATAVGGAQAGGVRLSIAAPARRESLEIALDTVARLLKEPEEVIV